MVYGLSLELGESVQPCGKGFSIDISSIEHLAPVVLKGGGNFCGMCGDFSSAGACCVECGGGSWHGSFELCQNIFFEVLSVGGIEIFIAKLFKVLDLTGDAFAC